MIVTVTVAAVAAVVVVAVAVKAVEGIVVADMVRVVGTALTVVIPIIVLGGAHALCRDGTYCVDNAVKHLFGVVLVAAFPVR